MEDNNVEIYTSEEIGCIVDTIYVLKTIHNDEGRLTDAYGKIEVEKTACGRFIKKYKLKAETTFYAFYFIYSKYFSAADGILFDAYLDELTLEEYLFRISNKEFVINKLKQIYELKTEKGKDLYDELFEKAQQFDEKIRMSLFYMINNIDDILTELREEFEQIYLLVLNERAAHTNIIEKTHNAVAKIRTGLGDKKMLITICFFARKTRATSQNRHNGIISCVYGIDQNKIYEYDYSKITIKTHTDLLYNDAKRLILETIAKGNLLSAVDISKKTYIGLSTVYRLLSQIEREHAIKAERYSTLKYRIDVRYFEEAEKMYLDYIDKFKTK